MGSEEDIWGLLGPEGVAVGLCCCRKPLPGPLLGAWDLPCWGQGLAVGSQPWARPPQAQTLLCSEG